MALTRRGPVTMLGALGAAAAAASAHWAEATAALGIAWAVLAAFALSMMLHGFGLRVLGVLLALLAIAGGVAAAVVQPWIIVAFGGVLVSAVLMVIVGPGWKRRRPGRVAQRDMWKDMDEGRDPTV